MSVLFARGPRIVFARVVTPEQTFHAYTVRDDAAGGLIVEWHGKVFARLGNIDSEEILGGWRVEGTNGDGGSEVWRISRLSCGCQHNGPTPTVVGDLALLV